MRRNSSSQSMKTNSARYVISSYPISSVEWSSHSLQLYDGKLELVWYYFPTAKSKTIFIKDINAVYYKWVREWKSFLILFSLRKQVFKEDLLVAKGWGKSCSNIWWACDMSRWDNSLSRIYSPSRSLGLTPTYGWRTIPFLQRSPPHSNSQQRRGRMVQHCHR